MTPGRRDRHMVDPRVRGERFSCGAVTGERPKMNQLAKVLYLYIRDGGVSLDVAMNI